MATPYRNPMLCLAWLAGTALLAGGCTTVERQYEAILLLGDLQTAPGETSRLQRRVGDPEVETLRYHGETGLQVADLYRPPGESRGNLVLIHGFTEEGKDDPRLTAFAESLARSGFRVLAPHIEQIRQLDWGPRSVDEVTDALAHMEDRPGSRDLPTGAATLSLMSGPVLLAASSPHHAEQVDFLVTIGGYYDVYAWIAFLTTGYDPLSGRRMDDGPQVDVKWALLDALSYRADDPEVRGALARIAVRRRINPDADVDSLVARLDGDALALFELLDNTDPERVQARLDALPDQYRDDLDALNIASRDLTDLPVELILIHGKDDTVIPISHSERLAERAPRATLYRSGGLMHVELSPGPLDVWPLWRAAAALLAQRDP